PVGKILRVAGSDVHPDLKAKTNTYGWFGVHPDLKVSIIIKYAMDNHWDTDGYPFLNLHFPGDFWICSKDQGTGRTSGPT
ncbi:MAG: hypothetical protein OEW75_19385, partial [Cyclobacteriaceae bacterium]|nr:hypothetical protein [Cyclobacteriaceae bacterium]